MKLTQQSSEFVIMNFIYFYVMLLNFTLAKFYFTVRRVVDPTLKHTYLVHVVRIIRMGRTIGNLSA